MPIISVIIPIYNVEPYLDRCLKSCLINDSSIEYILIDDGSTDNSYNIALFYKNKFNNVRLIHQKNQGLSNARNTGLSYATGSWIYFLDSDDYINSKFLPGLLDIINKYGNKFCIFSLPVMRVFKNGKRILQDGDNKVKFKDKYIIDVLSGKKTLVAWSYLYNYCFFKQNGIRFKNGALFEDQYFTPVIICKQSSIYEVSSKKIGFYYYQIRADSITHSNLTESKINSRLNAELYRDNYFQKNCHNNKISKLAESAKLSAYFRAMLGASIINNKKLFFQYKQKFRNIRKKGNFANTVKLMCKIIISNLPISFFPKFIYKLRN